MYSIYQSDEEAEHQIDQDVPVFDKEEQDLQHLYVCDHNFDEGVAKGVDPVPLVEKGFVDIARLSAGMAFGTKAFKDNKVSGVTMKALNKTHLMTLKNSDFIKFTIAMDYKKRMQLINFIRKIDLFAI